jgi:predicted enzyme related to lactoylglutathione lyase
VARFLAAVIDCADPHRLATFWQSMLGGEVDSRTASEEWIALIDLPAMGILAFQKVPEAKATKNRVHIDLEVADIATAVSEAVAAGAQVAGGVVVEPTNRFQVMLDPEGNEFCFIDRAVGNVGVG